MCDAFVYVNFSGNLRIPQDISYSGNPATLLVYIHDEQNECQIGQKVKIHQSKPISKTKSWKLLKLDKQEQAVK